MMGVVYQAKNKVNGKRYVGKTVGNMEDRKIEHERQARNGSKSYFHRALCKHGFGVFEWRVIGRTDNPNELNSVEIAMIRLRKSKVPNGYNLTDGGEGMHGFKHSEVSIQKNREKHLGKKQSMETRKKRSNSLKGRVLSIDTKLKISESVREGYTEEHKKKTAEGNRFRKITEKTRQAMRDSHIGKPSGNKGKKLSDTQKQTIRDKLLGRRLSDTHKRKISEGLKRFQASKQVNKIGDQ